MFRDSQKLFTDFLTMSAAFSEKKYDVVAEKFLKIKAKKDEYEKARQKGYLTEAEKEKFKDYGFY